MIAELLLQILEPQSTELKNLHSLPVDTFGKNVQEEIGKYYEEYKLFMGRENLPDYIFSYKKREGILNKDSYALAELEYINGYYHLWVTDSAFNRKDRKELLFHEFTHIYDKEYLFEKWRFSKESKLGNSDTHIYTEIHAEQIRLLLMLGANNQFQTNHCVDRFTVIRDLNEENMLFNEYLLQTKKLLIKSVDDVKKFQLTNRKISEEYLLSLLNKIAYYIGALSIYSRYCTYEVDNLMDLSNLSEFWEKDMSVFHSQVVRNISDLINMYCTRDIYSLNKMEIANSGTLLMYNWKKNAEDNLHIL